MNSIKELIDFVVSPIGLLVLLLLLLVFNQTRENLETQQTGSQQPGSQQPGSQQPGTQQPGAVTNESGVIQLPGADQGTRKPRGMQLTINPKTGEKQPPTTYEQVRDLLPTAASREGRDVWKQVVGRSSTFFKEDEAVQRAQSPISKPISGLPKVSTTSVFTVKAQKLANQDPQLSAALVSQQGLSGYMQASGKTREQIVDQLGMTLSEVNQTLSQELNLDPNQLEEKYAADGNLTDDLTLELKRKLEATQKKLAAVKQQNQTDPKILKAKPNFSGIQSNWIADQSK